MPSFDEILATVQIDELPQRQVCIVDPSMLLGEVYRLLDEEHGVAVLVCDGSKLLGIFTERDVLYRTAIEGDPGKPIGELMTSELVTLNRTDKLASAILEMSENGIRHIPVLGDEGEQCGLIGGRDVLRLISECFPKTLLHLPPNLAQKMKTAEGG